MGRNGSLARSTIKSRLGLSVSAAEVNTAPKLMTTSFRLLSPTLSTDFSKTTRISTPETESDSERDPILTYDHSTDKIEDPINPMVNNNADPFKNVLLAHVSRAIQVFSCVKVNKPILRRKVMTVLRDFGYNAGICKTKWETSGGLTAGNYEFIDVILSDSANHLTRYFIDLDFAGEFKVARPTNHYERLSQFLPSIFVGKSADLKQILKVMSDAAKRSLKTRGLHMPPWRKHRYLQNKYFGPYLRTLNLMPAKSSAFTVTAKPAFAVKCRSVGFNAVNGRLLFPSTTRTR
ncbi:unnamed protein product [Ilex paraguariensis]|uniref:DUF506 family protein n=1 Tax=Ilex paraguariensis TaxID=185542 RepID=A0ABC8SB32_9AQUA